MLKTSQTSLEKSPAEPNHSQIAANDTICIQRIRVAGKHGVSPAERQISLPLEINIELKTDLSQAQESDNLSDTINYRNVHQQIIEIVQNQSYKLLERLAAQILQELFRDQRIQAARITIAKPERLGGATPAVTLYRENPNTWHEPT